MKKGATAFDKIVGLVKKGIRTAENKEQIAQLAWDELGADFSTLEDSLGRAMLLSSLVAIEHVEDELADDVNFAELASSYARFDEASLLSKAAVQAILSKVPLTSEEYADLETRYKSQAFTIARVTSADVIESIKRDLAGHVKAGGTFAEWQKGIDKRFDALGISRANPRYLETVYRNNVLRSYNESNWNYAHKNAGRIALVEYHAIRDERTRPAHKAMHGFKAPLDSPIWDKWWPPNGHRCRCRVIFLSGYSVKRYGLVSDPVAPDVTPDKGWAVNPSVGLPPEYLQRAEAYGITS